MFKVAAIQMNSLNHKGENIKKAEDLLSKAVNSGAKFILLPENFSFMGDNEKDKLSVAESLDEGASINFLRCSAKKYKVWVAGGTIPLKTGDPNKVTNTLLIFNDQGEKVGCYDKIHLFDVTISDNESYSESNVIKEGNKPVTVKTPLGCLGLTICYDLRFPELYRKLTHMGAEIFLVPAAFTYATGNAHWEILLRARAIENQAYVIAAAQVGDHPGGRRTFGHSMIIDPWGQVLSEVDKDDGMALAEIDITKVYEVRKKMPCLTQRRMKSTAI